MTVLFYWTKMYPIALICWSPLSKLLNIASFPHVLESSCSPPVPKPILELQDQQSFSSLPTIPILALDRPVLVHAALKPSMLQLTCKEASGPTTDFHLSRPSEVLRYCPSAISEYRELALLVISIKLIWLLIFIPRQIRMCSSRREVLSPVTQIQSCLHQHWRCFYLASMQRCSGTFALGRTLCYKLWQAITFTYINRSIDIEAS